MSPSSSPSTLQHTLYLWPHGLFPRRLAYYLLASGLVPDTNTLFSGCTPVPNLKINIITLNPKTFAWEPSDPTAPPLNGKSMPALAITDPAAPADSPPIWIRESNSIILYLEANFGFGSGRSGGENEVKTTRRMLGSTPIDVAIAHDLLYTCNEAIQWQFVEAKHTRASTLAWSGMTAEEQSAGAAADGRRTHVKALRKMLEIVGPSLGASGWLTPGVVDGPGIVDVAVAAWARYLGLGYNMDVWEVEGMEVFKGWQERMEGLEWFRKYEEDQRVVHPEFMKFGDS